MPVLFLFDSDLIQINRFIYRKFIVQYYTNFQPNNTCVIATLLRMTTFLNEHDDDDDDDVII